jgi:Calcium-dependent channel, 7TM region, putative phosphate
MFWVMHDVDVGDDGDVWATAPELGMFWVMDLAARSDKARERLWTSQQMYYGYQTPDLTIAILLGLVFCVIAPLIAPVALLFFLATSELFKYQLLYVFTQPFESGGLVRLPLCSPLSNPQRLLREVAPKWVAP